MQKIKAQKSGELIVKNIRTCLFFVFFYVIIIKMYKVEKII